MDWRVVITKVAEKQLYRLPQADSRRIQTAIDLMERNPFHGDITKLGGQENVWRRRVGNYRIMYKLLFKERTIFIYDARRRASNTY